MYIELYLVPFEAPWRPFRCTLRGPPRVGHLPPGSEGLRAGRVRWPGWPSKGPQGAPRGLKVRAGEDVGEDVGGMKNEGIQPQKSWDYDVLAGLNRKNQGIMMFLMVLNVYKPSKCWGIRIV